MGGEGRPGGQKKKEKQSTGKKVGFWFFLLFAFSLFLFLPFQVNRHWHVMHLSCHRSGGRGPVFLKHRYRLLCRLLADNGPEGAEFPGAGGTRQLRCGRRLFDRSEEHTSELQSHSDLVCRLLLEKKKKYT